VVPKAIQNAERRTPNLALLLITLAVLAIAVGTVWFFMLRSPSGPPEPPGLTSEAKAYTKFLGLADVEMSAHDSFMQSTLVEIKGKITNKGDRPLKVVEINCVFYDPYLQVIHRERVAIVRAKEGPLPPSQTREFRLPFDAIPQTWNQVSPQLVIANIEFAP